MNYTTVSQLAAIKENFHRHSTKTLEFRQEQLQKLEKQIVKYSDEILLALFNDLRKPQMEAFTAEIAFTLEEIRTVQKNLAEWMSPTSVKTPPQLMPGKSFTLSEPLGVVLVLSPWNYPVQLALAPVIGAIAAGNCVVLKPSELAPNTSKLLKKMLNEIFAEDFVWVVEGGIEETTELLKHNYDYIFFTGSTAVGKIVMKAAAEHMTPVTLELGGKSPTIVTAKADIDLAAKRIAWGKFMNAGQICVAPDYVYVEASVHHRFVEKLKTQIDVFFGSDPQTSKSYARIINHKNFERLRSVIDHSKVVRGGTCDAKDLYIEPTLMSECTWNDACMKEEIFGPILPVLRYENLDSVFATIRSQPKPLAAYIFTEDNLESDRFLKELSFGGGCINDVVLHLANPNLPFGGVGQSGIGAYHGEKSFLTFSHQKSIVHKSKWLDFDFRYPPYKDKYLKWIKRIFRV